MRMPELAGLDTTQARALPGVLAVLTAADVAADGLNDLPPTVEANAADRRAVSFHADAVAGA